MSPDNGRGALVDWKHIGIRFRQMGYGTTDIARALNMPVSTVHKVLTYGSEPHYTFGTVLVGLFVQVERGAVNHLAMREKDAA